jgi:hypothetical protein
MYWITMDSVANTILDFAWTSEKWFALNVTNPKPSPWSEIFNNIRDALVEHGKPRLELVPFEQWLEKVKAQPQNKAAEIASPLPYLFGGHMLIRFLTLARVEVDRVLDSRVPGSRRDRP